MTKKNVARLYAANRNTKIIANGARIAGATLVNYDVLQKMGLMVEVVSTLKPLGIKLEVSVSKTKTVEFMGVSNTNVVSPVVEANTSTAIL